MAFSILNDPAAPVNPAGFGDQAEPEAVDWDILGRGFLPTGVLSGCTVTAQGTPDMTVAVAAGTAIVDGVLVVVAAGNVTITAADATNPRIDLIVVDSAGAKTATAGAANANACMPNPATSRAVLAAVYVPAADTAINANQITDKRVVMSRFLGGVASIVANDTQTNSVVNMSFGSFTIPANFVGVGTVLRIEGYWVTTTVAGPPTLTFELLVGGVVIETVVTGQPASVTRGGSVLAWVTIRTTGAAGTLMGSLQVLWPSTSAANVVPGSTSTATDAIDTTVANTIEVRARMTTAVATTTLTVVQGLITVAKM